MLVTHVFAQPQKVNNYDEFARNLILWIFSHFHWRRSKEFLLFGKRYSQKCMYKVKKNKIAQIAVLDDQLFGFRVHCNQFCFVFLLYCKSLKRLQWWKMSMRMSEIALTANNNRWKIVFFKFLKLIFTSSHAILSVIKLHQHSQEILKMELCQILIHSRSGRTIILHR